MATDIAPIYKFTLTDRTVTGTRAAEPVWKDDLTIDYEQERGQMFFRRKLSGRLNFVGDDYDWLMGRAYADEIGVTIQRSNDLGATWTDFWTGHFYKTDCEINVDDKRVTVQPEVDDAYNKILAGMEKEFNLIELLPETASVRIKKFPLIQIYYPGESIVSCIYNGMSWEQDVNQETSDSVLRDDYHFKRNSNKREMTLKQSGSVYGVYEGDVTADKYHSYDVYFTPVSGGAGTRVHVVYTVMAEPDYIVSNIVIQLLDSSNNELYKYENGTYGYIDTSNLSFTMRNGQGGTMDGQTLTRAVYARILLDVETFDGYETAPLSSSDFCHDNRNYTRAIGFTLGARYLMTSTDTQVAPTEYGKSSNGQYFVEPYSQDELYPIARTSWENTSIWFVNDGNVIDYFRTNGQKAFTLKTSYPVWSVIAKLLAQIDASLSHAATTAYSQFLYSATNPVSNNPFYTLLMTPKTNLLAGEFSEPAQKAPITLKDVLEMLRDVYQCYWHIDGSKLMIEHIKYYRNGGSYSVAPTVGPDITTMVCPRNGKAWGYGTSTYRYDKEQMPEQYQFGWMDDVTKPFMGLPIVIRSPYVDKGNIEETRVSMFTSDIDYLLLNPQSISKDGFALMAGQASGTSYYLNVKYVPTGWAPWVDKFLYLQNGELAFCLLQPQYLCYNLPARSIKINEVLSSARGIKRTKSQEVRVPMYQEPNPMKLIKTFLGNGYVSKISLNLTSRVSKCTLKYEPE